jgi:hypothetical protein
MMNAFLAGFLVGILPGILIGILIMAWIMFEGYWMHPNKKKLYDAMYVFMLKLCDWSYSGDEAAQCARIIMGRAQKWDELHPETAEELESLIIKDGDTIHIETPTWSEIDFIRNEDANVVVDPENDDVPKP